jgi:hypothetical protein
VRFDFGAREDFAPLGSGDLVKSRFSRYLASAFFGLVFVGTENLLERKSV